MNKDLGLTIGSRYSIVTLVFFIPYIILEVPVRYRVCPFADISRNSVSASLVPVSG